VLENECIQHGIKAAKHIFHNAPFGSMCSLLIGNEIVIDCIGVMTPVLGVVVTGLRVKKLIYLANDLLVPLCEGEDPETIRKAFGKVNPFTVDN
jgi:hypothetical protein